MSREKELVRIDRNGTKIFKVLCPCKRCGGAGGSDAWAYTGWTCYECGGNGGWHYEEVKEYTPEYEAKLAERRAKRAEKKRLELVAQAEEKNQEFFQKQGFNENGKTYVVLGNTYSVKDQLKELGCKWCNLIGWHSPVKFDGFEFVEIDADDVYEKDYAGIYRWNYWKRNGEETFSEKIRLANEEFKRQTPSKSEHQFNVGQKVEVELKVVRTAGYETIYGVTYINIMEDKDGNIFVWKTGTYFDEGSTVVLRGTVKGHSEYDGVKQTELTRCRVK
jgi:hypothetical protein